MQSLECNIYHLPQNWQTINSIQQSKTGVSGVDMGTGFATLLTI